MINNIAALELIRVLLIAILVYLAYIDLRTFTLPDAITLPLLMSGLCFNAFANPSLTNPQNSVLGAMVGFSLLWLINYFYRATKKQNGIGMGDAKLLAALGAWVGWQALPFILFIATISGLLGGIIWLRWQKQAYQNAFPFGPFLAFAGIIELLWPKFLQNLLLSNPI